MARTSPLARQDTGRSLLQTVRDYVHVTCAVIGGFGVVVGGVWIYNTRWSKTDDLIAGLVILAVGAAFVLVACLLKGPQETIIGFVGAALWVTRKFSEKDLIIPNWLRVLLAIVSGFIAWFAVAMLGNFAIRWLLPGYGEVEKTMSFSVEMLVARLLLGAVASLAAGAACILMARGARVATYSFAVLLLALFVPVHVGLWARFPAWYHIAFLGSLFPLVMLGARLPRNRTPGDAGATP